MPPPTTYRCTNGHEFYSYRRTLLCECAYPRCDGEITAVTGPLARKKEREK